MAAIKPTLHNLALFETFENASSDYIYTKAISLVPIPQKMPPEYVKMIKFIFNSTKTGSDISKNSVLSRTKAIVERNVVDMLFNIVAEADNCK